MNRKLSIGLVVAFLLAIWLADIQNGRVLKMRSDYRVDSAAPAENAPPLLAFTTVALGGFSSLVADVLWLRVATLQDEGRYFEIVQLADWITKLEPRCGDIWKFHAWNMAYNVSVMMPVAEDRWRWVKNGIELLRDQGILYNAGDPKVYWELSWLFLHKIAGTLDQAHLYYKEKWIEEMGGIFEGGSPGYDNLSFQPERLKKIKDEYKLKPEIMRMIDLEYGPLDWRTPESHAVYWAYCGRARSGGDQALPCEKLILQALRGIFSHGRLVMGPDGRLNRFPNMDLLPKIIEAFEAAEKKYPGESTVQSAYSAFMAEAVRLLYSNGLKDAARTLFARLALKFPTAESKKGFEEFAKGGRKKD